MSRGPQSLLALPQLLSREACKAVFEKVASFTQGGGETIVTIVQQAVGEATWVRNRMHIASEISTMQLRVQRRVRSAFGWSETTQLDDEGLQQVVRDAEYMVHYDDESPEHLSDPFIDEPILHPTLWSDATTGVDATARTDLVQTLIAPAEAAGLQSTGSLKICAEANATISSQGLFRCYPTTEVECSTTVRHPHGTASGWAGVNHFDLSRIDTTALAARALDLCQRSANPVAIEPGRYTVILSPQATADFVASLVEMTLDRINAEKPAGPFAGPMPGTSKITERVMDPRLVLRADPMDRDGGFLPYDRYLGDPYQPVNWIDHGILRELAYPRPYALKYLGMDHALLNPDPHAFRLMPAAGVSTATVDQMIAHTERGLLITRLHGVQCIDLESVLCTGYTRDGVWLIEHGKISKPVKNLRFTESPLFALNRLDEVGVPERVFAPGSAYVAPAVRLHDFNFTSLADAV